MRQRHGCVTALIQRRLNFATTSGAQVKDSSEIGCRALLCLGGRQPIGKEEFVGARVVIAIHPRGGQPRAF